MDSLTFGNFSISQQTRSAMLAGGQIDLTTAEFDLLWLLARHAGSILSRANKVGHRQLLEAQLTTCIAFCRACAAECQRHAEMHKHCEVCAKACQQCAAACTDMLSSMRMPA